MSKVSAIYHIIINTRDRLLTIDNTHREDLYRFLWKKTKEQGCVLYRINGVPNHIHMLIELRRDISLSSFMKVLKQTSSIWAKSSGLFPAFEGWGKGYAAFTCSYNDKDRIIEYIKFQQEHHKDHVYEAELRKLLTQSGMEYDEYLID